MINKKIDNYAIPAPGTISMSLGISGYSFNHKLNNMVLLQGVDSLINMIPLLAT